jgi:hypothetical protein
MEIMKCCAFVEYALCTRTYKMAVQWRIKFSSDKRVYSVREGTQETLGM